MKETVPATDDLDSLKEVAPLKISQRPALALEIPAELLVELAEDDKV